MHHDIGAVIDGTTQAGGGEGGVDHQRDTGFVRDFTDAGISEISSPGLPIDSQKHHLGVGS